MKAVDSAKWLKKLRLCKTCARSFLWRIHDSFFRVRFRLRRDAWRSAQTACSFIFGVELHIKSILHLPHLPWCHRTPPLLAQAKVAVHGTYRIIRTEVKRLISGVCVQVMVEHGHNTVRPVNFLPIWANSMLPTKQIVALLFPSLLDNAKQLHSVWDFEIQGSFFSRVTRKLQLLWEVERDFAKSHLSMFSRLPCALAVASL